LNIQKIWEKIAWGQEIICQEAVLLSSGQFTGSHGSAIREQGVAMVALDFNDAVLDGPRSRSVFQRSGQFLQMPVPQGNAADDDHRPAAAPLGLAAQAHGPSVVLPVWQCGLVVG